MFYLIVGATIIIGLCLTQSSVQDDKNKALAEHEALSNPPEHTDLTGYPSSRSILLAIIVAVIGVLIAFMVK